MRSDYQKLYENLKFNIRKLNAKLLEEDDLFSEFSLQGDWVLYFECEKNYGPSFTIGIRSKSKGNFAVWILMKVFSVLKNKDYGVFTIENQIQFLINEYDLIFNNTTYYKDKYDELNSGSY